MRPSPKSMCRVSETFDPAFRFVLVLHLYIATLKGLSGQTIFKPEYDWCFTTIPQKGVDGRVITQPRGKGLGGCSLVMFP